MDEYHAILKEVQLMCKELGLNLNIETQEFISKEVGNFVLGLLVDAENHCKNQKRTNVTSKDIKNELSKLAHPFDEIIE